MCTNSQPITINFATDIYSKCIFENFQLAARGRSKISWRHRYMFWTLLSDRRLTPLKASSYLLPLLNNKPLPATSGFDRKAGSYDFTYTRRNEDRASLHHLSQEATRGNQPLILYGFLKITILIFQWPVTWHIMTSSWRHYFVIILEWVPLLDVTLIWMEDR